MRHGRVYHGHWFAEWWSGVLLVLTGGLAMLVPDSGILHHSLVNGFVRVLPSRLWEGMFMLVGVGQLVSLLRESMTGRGVSAFGAATLYGWAFLNIVIYGHEWHVSLIGWGVFTAINLYALSRILRGVERRHEFLGPR